MRVLPARTEARREPAGRNFVAALGGGKDPVQLTNTKGAREMRRRLRAWIAPVVMAGLTIWASGVTLGELRAEEGDDWNCYEDPLMCVGYDGECGGWCAKGVAPAVTTCCWILPE